MTEAIILPGIGGSGETHWQTYWEAENPSFYRFRPKSWDQPDLEDWLRALDSAVHHARTPVVLVAHSLACLLVAHAADRFGTRVRGAFLVSVPDPESSVFPVKAADFGGVPSIGLPFPTLIIASSDDPYGSISHARRRASEWKAGLVEVGAFGHINAASGLGAWRQGFMLLEAFRAGLRG